MKREIFILILLLFFIKNENVEATNESIRIDDYSYKDGLTTSSVYNVLKDSKGFIWICSNNGLYRFDGYSFRKLNTLVNGIPNHDAYCITEDNEQNFWIGTSNKGVIHFNTHTKKLSQVKLDLGRSNRIYKIIFHDEKIWIATNYGVLVVTPEKEFNENSVLKTRQLLPDTVNLNSQINKINNLYTFPNCKSLWVCTNGSLFELNTSTLFFKYIASHPQNAITGMTAYKNSLIAGSWDGGIFGINTTTKRVDNDEFINYANKVLGNKCVASVYFDNFNRLWVATCGSGLFIFQQNGKNFSFENYSNDKRQNIYLKSDYINQMYVDDSGIAWLGMNYPALSKVYFKKNDLQYLKLSESVHEIISIYNSAEKDKIWVSTNGKGIFLYNLINNKSANYNTDANSPMQLVSNNVTHCYQDKKGNIWLIYNRAGLYILPSDNANKLLSGKYNIKEYPIDANILLNEDNRKNSYTTKIYEDNSGRVWIALWGSLYVIETKKGFQYARNIKELKSESNITCVYSTDTPTENGIPTFPVISMLEKKPGTYWLGTLFSGIIQIKEISYNVFEYSPVNFNEKLPGNNIKALVQTSDDKIWIGTNAGLCIYDQNDQIKQITEKEGLASENINNIIEDANNDIWVSTTYGISRINKIDLSVNNFLFSNKDMLNQYILNAANLSSDGKLCFSLSDALVKINPDSIKLNSIDPPIYITDLKIDNKTVNPFERIGGTKILKADVNECELINVPYNHTLSLEFASLDYKNSVIRQYKYQIGKNKEWILLNSNQRSLSFPGMKPGEYLLSVMLENSNETGKVKKIRIHFLPPLWQSNVALVMYFIILLVLFLSYRRLIMQKLVQKSLIEKERYERKKLEELDKMKSEFFSNISHEFRTPLSLIINPLEKLAKDENIPANHKTKINLVLKSSNRLLKLTNELMDFSKMEKKLIKPYFQETDILQLLRETCSLFNNLADSNNIDFRLNSSVESIKISIDKAMIEKVIFNLLSNAFKYTPTGGVILCNISKIIIKEAEFVKLSVINTGQGIAKAELDKIFDRYYQVNNISNRNIEGTGIGLALVKNFVELHNGKVEVTSEPNDETCFDVIIPFKNVPESRDSEKILSEIEKIAEIKNSKPTSHYQLLLVEDDDDIRNYVAEELSIDFRIATAKDGNEGISIANDLSPDLIITDVLMPGISGIELCKHLKNQVATSHIPIIILSAKTTTEQQIEGLAMGADVYMIKPFSIGHLKAQIIRLIEFKETVYARFLKETTLIPQGATTSKIDEEFLNKIMNFIEENLSNSELSVDELAKCVMLSKVQVYRKLKAISGLSVVEFIRTVRLKKAAQMVLDKRYNFSEIAFETGFSTPSYFSKCFHDHFGKTPSEFASDYGNK